MYRVLIIDDEPWSREVVKSLGQWERLGLAVAGEAEDGNDGIGMIEALRPDIVVTDMRMPGLDGIGLLQEINERFPYLKLIVISGYDDFVYLKQAVRSRAADYLLKPLDPVELNASLEKCVRELERERQAGVGRATSSAVLFADQEEVDRYLACKRHIRQALLELNKPAAMHALAKLDENTLLHAGQDLVLLLEEFAASHHIDLREIRSRATLQQVDAAVEIAWLYDATIDAALAVRHNRNRLDLSEVAAYIDRHFQEPISLESIANAFYVTKEHLSRVFKAHTGSNISDYILNKKMDMAKELITAGMPIKHAAELTGYADVAYFYRVFKKRFGVTPGELRKEKEHQYCAKQETNMME